MFNNYLSTLSYTNDIPFKLYIINHCNGNLVQKKFLTPRALQSWEIKLNLFLFLSQRNKIG